MKIIFLDIDGVLNSQLFYTKRKRQKEQSKAEYRASNIDPNSVSYLNGLIEATGAKVVISSTWRMGSTKEELQSVLNANGFTGDVIDVTPILHYDGVVRGNEIYAWIQKNSKMLCGSNCDADFKEYVIFDDDSDMLYWQRNNYIQVDAHCGLTPNQCYRAKFILCRDMTFSNSFGKP